MFQVRARLAYNGSEPGDGKDNDLDGDIDEDECCKYKCL